MKYIRDRHRGIFIFPLKVRHDQMAEWLGGEIISAGYIEPGPGRWPQCVGRSSTLKLGSLDDDTEVLHEQGCLWLTKLTDQ
jgi:hypothetical protein